MSTVAIENIGAIRQLVIDLPDGEGGVLVLLGTNRQGKSTAIEIIRALLGRKTPLTPNDEAHNGKGRAEGFGRTLSVTSKTLPKGELEVPSLEGRFDFSDLVLPKGESEEVRDRIRVKALLCLTGARADVRLFYDLVGGQEEFERIVAADKCKTDDLIELAGRVKRAIDAEALKRESDAQHAEAHATACKLAAGDVTADKVLDLAVLHAKSTEITAELSRLQERARNAAATDELLPKQRAKLEKALAEYKGLAVEGAKEVLLSAEAERTEDESKLAKLRQQVADQEARVAQAKIAHTEARAKYDAAVNHDKSVAELKADIEAKQKVVDEAPTAMDLRIASEDADDAKKLLELAITIRDAAKKAAEAKEHEEKAKVAAKAARALRDAAGGVDHVLSTQLPPGPLRAHKGRVVCDTERGEAVPFDECSDGEKYRLALPYGINSVGSGGFLALQQGGWQDLGVEYRREIAEACRTAKVWLITAELTNGELRSEVFQS